MKPETSTDNEGGFKWTFLENRARLNVALFHQKFNNFIYSGLPVTYLGDNGSDHGSREVQFQFQSERGGERGESGHGIPSSRGSGASTSTPTIPTAISLAVRFRATRPEGHYGRSAPPPYVYLCPSHASTSVAPNFNSRSVSRSTTCPSRCKNIDGFVRGLWDYYGRNPHSNAYYMAPSYGIVNLFLGLRGSDKAWEAAFFVKNAFNAEPVLINSTGNPTINVQP